MSRRDGEAEAQAGGREGPPVRVQAGVPPPVGKTEDKGIRAGVQETVCEHRTLTMLDPGGPSAGAGPQGHMGPGDVMG